MNTNPCPRCGSVHTIKNGQVMGEARRKCRDCAYQYTRTERRGRSREVIHTAVILYLFGLSMRAIGRLLKVSAPGVLAWIRQAGKTLAQKPIPSGSEVVELELDEMWHFLEKKVTSYGFGKPTTEPLIVCLTGNAALVIGRRSTDCSND